MKKLLLLVLVAALVSCDGGGITLPTGCDANVNWSPPTERLGGAPLSVEELEKFTIYVSKTGDTDQKELERVLDVNDTYLISWRVENLGQGTHWFYMTATDTEGNVSGYSNILSMTCT